MANRLPTVGGDSGIWGTVLNEFLGVEHAATGIHKMGTGLVTENVNTVASSGATQTIPSPASYTINNITLSENCTITVPAAATGQSFTVVLRQSNPGGQTVTWTGSIKWSIATAPVLTTTASAVDVVIFFCVDGSNWIGILAGQDMR